MSVIKYILIFIVFIILANIYKLIKTHELKRTSKYYMDMINKYLLTLEPFGKNNKPCLWIHLHNNNTRISEKNAREWLDFYSRSTDKFNQPYQILTIKSILNLNSDDFNVILIDDESFNSILPNWTINLTEIANPIRTRLRTLALTTLLNVYGGMIVPSSFICLKPLKTLYINKLQNHDFIVGEFVNRTLSSSEIQQNLIPYSFFMIGKPNSPILLEFIKFQEMLYSKNFTSEIEFIGFNNKWLLDKFHSNQINLIEGEEIGTKNNENEVVLIENLLCSKIIEFKCNNYGVYIPWDELIFRTHYNWFVYLNLKEVLSSDTCIGKLLLQSSNL